MPFVIVQQRRQPSESIIEHPPAWSVMAAAAADDVHNDQHVIDGWTESLLWHSCAFVTMVDK